MQKQAVLQIWAPGPAGASVEECGGCQGNGVNDDDSVDNGRCSVVPWQMAQH